TSSTSTSRSAEPPTAAAQPFAPPAADLVRRRPVPEHKGPWRPRHSSMIERATAPRAPAGARERRLPPRGRAGATDQREKQSMGENLSRHEANAEVLRRFCAADPVLEAVVRAGDVVPGMTPTTILTSGPPMEWPEYW